MKPVFQTRKGVDNKPNCMAACIASILEDDIDKYDQLDIHNKNYWDKFHQIILDSGHLPIWHNEEHPACSENGYVISLLKWEGFPFTHSVVSYFDGKNYTIQHDPYGSPNLGECKILFNIHLLKVYGVNYE